MIFNDLYKALLRLQNIDVRIETDHYIIANREQGYAAKVLFDEIDDYSPVVLPDGETGIQIFYRYEGGLVVTSTDFMFDTLQGPYFTVPDLPDACTINMIVDNLLRYRENPTPSIHTEKNITIYYAIKYLIDSAAAKGFDITSFRSELQRISRRTGLEDILNYIEYGGYTEISA